MNTNTFIRRITAFFLSGVMAFGVISYAREAYVWPQYPDVVTASFSEAANDSIRTKGYVPTGLSFEWTYTDKSTSSLGFEKYWADKKEAKTGSMNLSGSQETVEIDFSKFDHKFISCIADHVGFEAGYKGSLGTQLALVAVYFPTDNVDDYPYIIKTACKSDINRMKFNLLLISLLHNKIGSIPDEEIKDSMSYTGYAAVMYCAVRAIEVSPGFMGNTAEDDWDRLVKDGLGVEILNGYNPDTTGSTAIWDSYCNEGKAYFIECWEQAKFLSNFNYTAHSISLPMPASAVISDGLYHRGFDYGHLDPVTKKYMQAIRIKQNVDGIDFVNDGSRIDFSSVNGDYIKEDSPEMGQIVLELDQSALGIDNVELAPSGLCGFKFLVAGYDGTKFNGIFNTAGQTRFAAYQTELNILLGDYPAEPVPPSGDEPDDPQGDYKIEIHRYDHSEGWESHYNINLRKYDSETGKPLEGAEFDILEAFDDGQLASTDLESTSNWANKNGSQFVKWEGWDYGPGNRDGDAANDPCEMDGDITNEDGVLTNGAIGDIAHYDTKYYTYNKGYCGGHPAPTINYYKDNGSNSDKIKDLNSKLEKDAQEAWQAEVDKCSSLSAEGGFFHSEEADVARKELEADRDNYYKQFISLTYDYSAAEIVTRPGYIQHGLHSDDIPVEVKTVTSSEYKDFNSEKEGMLPHTSDAETDAAADDEMEAAVYSFSGRPTAHAVIATSSDALPGAEANNVAPIMAGFEFSVIDSEAEEQEEYIADLDISAAETETEDYQVASSSEAKQIPVASASNAAGDLSEEVNFLESLFQAVKTFFSWIGNGMKSLTVSLFSADQPDDDITTLRNSTEFEKSTANQIGELRGDIIEHTFILFNHRTEGEIHFNKRDLNLDSKNSESFESYAVENGDGTVEGAVYGLFAARDIVHPDGKTGVVYKKGNLVAVASTDLNGDASFMAFTEVPGVSYDYGTGMITRTEDGWTDLAPKNMHTDQNNGDAFSMDNESYVGYDSMCNAQSLTDSSAGDGTVYYKHSSNQAGLEGVKGSFTAYPIMNNETNNKNCWIGRPLIVQPDGSSYLIKELSRSEGYELSVSGKENTFTNGKESYAAVEEISDVSITIPEYDLSEGALYSVIRADKVNTELHLEGRDLSEGAAFAISETVTTTEMSQVPYSVEVTEPIIGPKDSYVYLEGKRVEAVLGETLNINGIDYVVNNVSAESPSRLGIMPRNYISYGTPYDTTLNTSDFESFMREYNDRLEQTGYEEPFSTSPWAKIELTGANDTEWLINITQYIVKHHLIYFNRMRIQEIINENGTDYAMLYYDYSFDGTLHDDAIYNPDDEELYIRKDTGNGYDVFVSYQEHDPSIENIVKNESGFLTSASLVNQQVICNTVYPEALPDTFVMVDIPAKSYWCYDGIQQKFNDDGTLAEKSEWVIQYREEELTITKEVLTPLTAVFQDDVYTITIPESVFDSGNTVKLKIYNSGDNKFNAMAGGKLVYKPMDGSLDTYTKNVTLYYKNQNNILEDNGTIENPVRIQERPIRQKIKVRKDILTLPDKKLVWYCKNCGMENYQGSSQCSHCQKLQTTEEVRAINYEHDTYSAVHKDNISADRNAGVYEVIKDWLYRLMNGESEGERAESLPDFRFKAYLKSNLERIYRSDDGTIVWVDRYGNTMTPLYQDLNGDGNYDSAMWSYDVAYDGKKVDFPEKDIVSESLALESTNVQKLFTKVQHETASMTVSSQSNNVWDIYDDPQAGVASNVGEKEGYSTSLRNDMQGGMSGKAVNTNSTLYSYDGINFDAQSSDRINDGQNSGFTRLLETCTEPEDDGKGGLASEPYNYVKFFDALYAANTDVWDNDMHTTFTGTGMANYPGQHWTETFYEKYQMDDADPDYTLDNTDGVDKDGTAGGDRDTSFKPFSWIREKVSGSRADYETYPAVHSGENTETSMSTSEYAKANAEASDAARQFAIKWYLEDEASKLMQSNGSGENIALGSGTINYEEETYDQALFQALQKAYNYLKPFYMYDLDTIYSIEWDAEPGGGSDHDYTTLAATQIGDGEYSGISSYLPYGTYIISEQQPERRDKAVDDYRNRSFTIDKPKEVYVPSVYENGSSNQNADNYDQKYRYDSGMSTSEQASAVKYLIRFGEEWSDEHNPDQREYVIRAHNHNGDYEIFKYGLDIDKLSSTIRYSDGSYDYAGFKITQEIFDPLKDYYALSHRNGNGLMEIGEENGGAGNSCYLAINHTDNVSTANGGKYDGEGLANRFYYGVISEDKGIFNNIVNTMTGELTAYDHEYAPMLVPWTVTGTGETQDYSSADYTGYTDVYMHNEFYSTRLKINKIDSETGEHILHDNAIFALYAGSRYTSFEEIEKDAELIADTEERERFLRQFKPGDAKFYLKDTVIEGSKEFLEAMGAEGISKAARETGIDMTDLTNIGLTTLYYGTVKKGTPICIEKEKIMLSDETGEKRGQMTVYTTLNDVLMANEANAADQLYADQNTGYFITPEAIGSGVYVLAELKAPDGYVRSRPIPYEIYSDKTQYYADGDMYAKVTAARYTGE